MLARQARDPLAQEHSAIQCTTDCWIDALLNRLSYFVLPAFFVLLLPLGLLIGAPWLGILLTGVAVPLADEIIGPRLASRSGPTGWEVRIVLIALLIGVGWSLFQAGHSQDWTYVVFAALSSGYVLGVVGIPGAHELGHRRPAFDRLLGETVLACIGYGHYRVAHNRHHFRACLPDDPASARGNEGLWAFLPRYFLGIWLDAKDAASHLRGASRHRPVLLMSASLIMLFAAAVLFGWRGFVFWSLQAIVGLFLISGVDYIQHWGLTRKQIETGRFERTGPRHTWESPFWLSEHLTFNMTRHNFHHLQPSKHSSRLERVPAGPQLPHSYGTMLAAAIFPPLFRRLMTPRLPQS